MSDALQTSLWICIYHLPHILEAISEGGLKVYFGILRFSRVIQSLVPNHNLFGTVGGVGLSRDSLVMVTEELSILSS